MIMKEYFFIKIESKHKLICELKSSKSLSGWCREPFEKFKDFANELDSLTYEAKPNYGKLRNMIQALIHQQK